jgi:type I restriction enzyme M protein
MSLTTTIKSIQDVMRKDTGIDGDAQRISQLGWMVFFKIFSDLELQTELEDDNYVSPVPPHLRWDAWANEKEVGASAPTGEDLLELIDRSLFPTFKNLDPTQSSGVAKQRAALLRSVFEDAYNYMKSGTLLRQVVNKINYEIDFNQSKTRHLFGEIYEQILQGLQGAGNAGEYYTPRAATQFAVEMLAPQKGESVLDPACGTGGFLTGAFEYVRADVAASEELRDLKSQIRGVEKKPLPHLLCVTNLMVHGIEVPNIRHGNTLARPLRDYGPSDLVDIIATNPPFVGMEEDGIETNFPAEFRTRETAHLFTALAMELLKPTGRAAIVLPDSFLFGEGVPMTLRQKLLQECNLHTIVRLPNGVFAPYTDIRTNILFFERTGPTETIWFYEIEAPPGGGKFTKTNQIEDSHFDDARKWWTNRSQNERAWSLSVEDVLARPYLNLDVENPTQPDSGVEFERRVLKLESDESEAGARWDKLADVIDSLGGSKPLLTFFEDLQRLRNRVQLTGGYVEELRLTTAELALRGHFQGTSRSSGHAVVAELERRTQDELPPSFGPPFEIPENWAWAQLGQISDFAIGKTPPTKESKYWLDPADPDGIPFISISDMPRRGVVTSVERAVSPLGASEDLKREPIKEGTLLMAFKLSVGKTAFSGLPGAFFNEAIAAIDITDETVRNYLRWCLPVMAGYGSKNPAVRGATLNKKAIQSLWVPIPPKDEQRALVDALSLLGEMLDQYAIAHEHARASATEALKLLRAKSRSASFAG